MSRCWGNTGESASLLRTHAHMHTHTQTITVVSWMKLFFCRAVTNCRLLNCKSASDCSENLSSIFYFSKLVNFLNQDFRDRLSSLFPTHVMQTFPVKRVDVIIPQHVVFQGGFPLKKIFSLNLSKRKCGQTFNLIYNKLYNNNVKVIFIKEVN